MTERTLTISTDGASSKYPKNHKTPKLYYGAAGFVAVDSETEEMVHLQSSARMDTTNQREELIAILEALKWFNQITDEGSYFDYLSGISNLVIHSDSEYCVLAWNERMDKWCKNDWRTNANKPVSNKDLILEFYDWKRFFKDCRVTVTIKWVRGHNNDQYNEIADKLATEAKKSFGIVLKSQSIGII